MSEPEEHVTKQPVADAAPDAQTDYIDVGQAAAQVPLQEEAPLPLAEAPAAPAATAGLALPVHGHALRARVDLFLARTLPVLWYRATRIGPAGLVGGAATLAAIAIAAAALLGEGSATATLSEQLARARAGTGTSAPGDMGVGRVVALLPRRNEIPAVVGVIYEQARAANVALDNGHYAYSPPKSGSIGRYEFEFPVKADYPSVRHFISGTLSAVPAAGLDKLHIERKAVGEQVVNADIRFVVFVRAEGSSP